MFGTLLSQHCIISFAWRDVLIYLAVDAREETEIAGLHTLSPF